MNIIVIENGQTYKFVRESMNNNFNEIARQIEEIINQGGNTPVVAEASLWLAGDTEPSDDIGKDNDFYLQSTTGTVYNKKDGCWEQNCCLAGPQGECGEPGEPGEPGEDGKSAYELWLELGNSGTEEEFIDSLHGEDGEQGENGKSAYELWLELGNSGTEEDFLNSLKGTDGTSVNILGDFNSNDELPDVDQKKGDSYLINGDLWVYTASIEPDAVNGFVNVGSIKGPAGNDGLSPTITENVDNSDDVVMFYKIHT